MMNWTKARTTIEKNGLMVFAVSIVLLYWTIDIITDGSLASRILLTISILAYGMMTQFLLNKQKTTTDSLKETRDALQQSNEELANVNKELEMAYAWMRDNRDELKHHLYEEDIAFLLDEDGKIEGVTERTLLVMQKSRDAVIGTYLMQMMPKDAREDCERDLRQAWKGIIHQLKSRIIMSEGGEQEFEMKFSRLTVSGKRLLLVILNR